MQSESLYVHIPFCERKCHYCDFYSLGTERLNPEEAFKSFATALETEAWLQAPSLAHALDTVFLGGGTPSLLPPELLGEALAPLLKRSSVTRATEWTMEANPSSITRAGLLDLRKLGVNRLSIGIQSLDPALLKLLGRIHSRETALKSLETALNCGFDNLSVDLLCGVPGQTIETLEATLRDLAEFPLTHLSCYLLTLTPGNPLHSKLPDEEAQLTQLLFVDQWLTRHGFEHYEISNFCKPGFRARHNMNYWKGEPYLGLGPSAHSFDPEAEGGPKRWKNVSSVEKYEAQLAAGKLPIDWSEALSPEQREIERWMLALRLSDGFPAEWLDTPKRRNFGERLKAEGLLQVARSGNLYLTPKGLALSDEIAGELI